ncbi:Hypothetical protein NATL1_15801 [Prochlorococcus marinus str. NATL1A]|uniref:Lipoprotein n=1 Tax=Prochlorococcus marinus (strain NATL1A) TaxID=167555 RepID=A2C3S7_PROM1|nr:Hypothetical protein NATL1_15801 [Prochlorococcus marinus str. NATL1A]
MYHLYYLSRFLVSRLYKTLPLLVIASFSTSLLGCSNSSNSVSKTDPCEIIVSENSAKESTLKEAESNETLRGIRSHTTRKVVLMPITSATGTSNANPYMGAMMGTSQSSGAELTGFATEIMNQAFRNEGIKTVAWFKVSKKLKEVLNTSSGNSYSGVNMFGGNQTQVNDENLNEVIEVAKELDACYVVRPVILKSSNTSNTQTSYNPVGLALGFGGLAGSTKTTNNAEIDIKIDIISTREEDIIASKTFSGRSAQVTKKRANTLDGITGSNLFSGGSSTDQLRIAFYDTIDKIVEFLEDKML